VLWKAAGSKRVAPRCQKTERSFAAIAALPLGSIIVNP
jgi:hypothetical protein